MVQLHRAAPRAPGEPAPGDPPRVGGVAVPLPFLHGRYEVAPGMTRLAVPAAPESNAGHFVVGTDARGYLLEKLRLLATHAERHRVLMPGADDAALATVLRATLALFADEHPTRLVADGDAFVSPRLALRFDPTDAAGVRVARVGLAAPGWEEAGAAVERQLAATDGLVRLADCAALLVQEDYAVVRDDGSGRGDAAELLHVCFPSHWDPREKAGHHFGTVHAPVASNGVLLRAHENIVRAIITKGPFLRHAWGVARDDRLDGHPACAADDASGDRSAVAEPAYLRVERQTTRGFPELQRALFTIRTYLVPFSELRRDPPAARALASALRGMTADERRYKGLSETGEGLAEWLET